MNKRLITFNYITIGSSLLFSIFQIHFVADISLTAFPLALFFTLVAGLESIISLLRHHKASHLPFVIKLYQYLPFVLLAAFVFRRAGNFGTTYSYDLITVLLWVMTAVCSQVVLYFLNPKRFFEQNTAVERPEPKIRETKKTFASRAKRVIFEIFDWIDAIIQAICTVSLVYIFIVQLYEIPSESMASEFLVKDRVVGLKIASGPKFPLSEVGLPYLRSYERGDIVIFRNPHYAQDRKSEIQTFISQFVHLLTLSMVNTNVDENGDMKADPLVKRIVGIPGEQLVMQDGILYSRTTDNPEFVPVSEELLWAEWNIAGLPSDILKKIEYIPQSNYEYQLMLDIEQERRNLHIADAKNEALALSERFSDLKANTLSSQSINASVSVGQNNLQLATFLRQSDTIIRDVFYSADGEIWFESFMTDWINSVPQDVFTDKATLVGGDVYTDAMFRQNLMIKLAFGNFAVRTAELLHNGVGSAAQNQDAQRLEYFQAMQILMLYALQINDMRNMPLFPPNNENGEPQYIEEHNYFLMGDNRFNSLDMRHSYDYERIAITDFDVWSFYYDSNISPQSISRASILGTPILRFFPFSRFGVPGFTAVKSIDNVAQ